MVETSPEEHSEKAGLKLPSWKKISEFLLSVWEIERSVASLKADNKKLREEMQRMQRQIDDQAGQLKVLLTFVQGSLRDQVEAQAQRAAINALGRLIDFQGGKPEDER